MYKTKVDGSALFYNFLLKSNARDALALYKQKHGMK